MLMWQKALRTVTSLMSLLIRALIPFMRAEPSWSNYLPEVTSEYNHIGDLGFYIGILREHKLSVHRTYHR